MTETFKIKIVIISGPFKSKTEPGTTFTKCECLILDGKHEGKRATIFANYLTNSEFINNMKPGNIFSGAKLLINKVNQNESINIDGNSNFKFIGNSVNTDNFQQCSHLIDGYEDLYSKSNDTLADCYNLQADTQKNVYGYDFKNMSLRDIMNFWHMNNHALIDELHEATNALGGIADGDGSAIWKKWKKAYNSFDNKSISDLSESDLLELKFEVVDLFHFFLNIPISIGMSVKELYNLYMLKNKENRDRQARGY